MPELPEVETIARDLRTGADGKPPLPGRKIEDVEMSWPRHIAEPSPDAFRRRVKGRRFQAVDRRGKYFVLDLDHGTLLVHLRMTGDLILARADEARGPYDHTVFLLDDGWELRFSDARKFGRIRWVNEPDDHLSSLGPEPLDEGFTSDDLFERLRGRRRTLKPLLLDQSFIAGLGNIYADEALHRAGIHPLTRSNSLTRDQAHALWQAIREALRAGIRNNGTSLDWVYRGGNYQELLRVYGREGEPCPVCGTEIIKIIVAQRGTHFCPTCQPEMEAA